MAYQQQQQLEQHILSLQQQQQLEQVSLCFVVLRYCFNFFVGSWHWQCCGSGMIIPDPDFYPSRVLDLGSRIQKQQQKRGVKKKFFVKPFSCSHKLRKI
jgi:hypothetical protein